MDTETASIYDAAFYALAWGIAAVCGILATSVDHRHRDRWDLLAIGSLSGFIAVGCVGFLVRVSGGTVGSEPYFLAISIAVGILGKRGLRTAQWITEQALSRIGVDANYDRQRKHKSSVSSNGDDSGGDNSGNVAD